MSICAILSPGDIIISADVFVTDAGTALLSFKDKHGVARFTLHDVPRAAAVKMAAVLNDAIAERKEPEE